MIILAIDPGDPAGWAKFIGGEYDGSGTINGDSPSVARDLLIALGPDVLVLEDQHPGKSGWKSLRTLMRRRFIWEVVAELEGVEVHPMDPSTWQGFYRLKKGKHAPKMVEQYSPLASALIGREVWGDEAAAILMGMWGVTNCT